MEEILASAVQVGMTVSVYQQRSAVGFMSVQL